MKTKLLLLTSMLTLSALSLTAQVTQINSNKSLFTGLQLNGKAIFTSTIDSTMWISDGTAAGTTQFMPNLHVAEMGGVINNRIIFSAISAGTGEELWATDGTVAGTVLLADIYPGPTGSRPGNDMTEMNGFVYFTAQSPSTGRELYRTNGTVAGTALVKDIIEGPESSIVENGFDIYSNNSYILFSAKTPSTSALGTELYISDGTSAGTRLLKDLNEGSPSSTPSRFFKYNNIVLFTATDAEYGAELWKTDGTSAGTVMVKDINPGTPSSGMNGFFMLINGRAYFTATSPEYGTEIWGTDGTEANTRILKDIMPGPIGSSVFLLTSAMKNNKLYFTAFTMENGVEMWETDGTETGTKLFKDLVPGPGSSVPAIFPSSFDFTGTNPPPLFQGNKFFLMATTPDEGSEIWVSDGTVNGTRMIKDINEGDEDGLEMFSYVYTSAGLYFSANNGTLGNELWFTDGTNGGTRMIADINVGPGDSDIFFTQILNNKLIFSATNGDSQESDLYVLDANIAPLPIKLVEFTVTQKTSDALLQWSTSQEINSKDFTIERSFDGSNFTTIGLVNAAGSSSTTRNYSYIDNNVMNSGKEIVYYRLVMNDKDGKHDYSKIISIRTNGISKEWTVKLLNNPVQGDVKLMLSGVTESARISIKDMNGRTIQSPSTKANGQSIVPTSNLQPGIYLLVVENNREMKTLKFVKQ